MAEKENIRWQQRLDNYQRTLQLLNKAADLSKERALTELEQQGLIQSFEYTHELAWNVMKDYFTYQGNPEIRGSRDATREAFKVGIIAKGEVWMDMIISRNKTTQTYDEKTAREITDNILKQYVVLFNDFKLKMDSLRNDNNQRRAMEFGLNDKVLEKITDVFESVSGIEEAIIYGSRALGNFREGSDIDITLKGEISFNDLIQIEKELDEKMLPYTFDISVYPRLSNQDLVAHIDRVGKPLYVKKKIESS